MDTTSKHKVLTLTPLLLIIATITFNQFSYAEGQSITEQCPSSPNCVSSLYPEDKKHYIAPIINHLGSKEAAKEKLSTILQASKGFEIVATEENYLRAEHTSRLFSFIDDVEFQIDNSLIQVRSASRVGHSDLGVNRKRIEKIRKQFSN